MIGISKTRILSFIILQNLIRVIPLKKITFTSFALLTLACSAYAEGEYENPGLSAYMAEKAELPPPPKLEFPFPEGVYVGATIGSGKIKPMRIEDQAGRQLETTNQSKKTSVAHGGVSIGYLFKEAGWFNQIDLQYINRKAVTYEATTNNCIFIGKSCTLNTSVRTQTGMVRLYSTLNIGHSIFPYMFAGVGFYHNKAPATLTLPNGRVIPLFINTNNDAANTTIINNTNIANGGVFVEETIVENVGGQTLLVNDILVNDFANNTFTTNNTRRQKPSRFGGAGSIGAGMRLRVSPHIMLDVNYEYTYLGKTQDWHVPRRLGARRTTVFKGDKLNGQSINLSIILQPWGFASEGD